MVMGRPVCDDAEDGQNKKDDDNEEELRNFIFLVKSLDLHRRASYLLPWKYYHFYEKDVKCANIEDMKEMLKGFRNFIVRGSVVDLAVGIMIGAAFNTVVSSLVKDLMTPLVAAIFKQPNFATLSFTLNGSQFMYGDFFNNLISFLITAATIYFFIVLPINRLNARMQKGPPPAATTKACQYCLSNIPVGAKKCMYCTADLGAAEK